MATITAWDRRPPPVVLYETSTPINANIDYDTPEVGDSPASGDWIEIGAMREIELAGEADQITDDDGVAIELSLDGSSVWKAWTHTAAIDEAVEHLMETGAAKYARCYWKNKTTNQGSFEFRVIGRY